MNNTPVTLATIIFDTDVIGRCLYTEAIPLHEIGLLNVERATRIEFDNCLQVWRVNDKRGIALYTSPSRRTCLQWEHQYFNQD